MPSSTRLLGHSFTVAFAPLLAMAACGGSSTTTPVFHVDGGHVTTDGAGVLPDVGTGAPDAVLSHDAGGGTDTGMTPLPDAAPAGMDASRNAACTPLSQQNGTAVDSSHGRLDGTLVYIVGVDQGRSCNGDNSHVHLQVEVSGSVYDVAVDIGTAPSDEVGLYEQTMAVPGGAWSEGWHGQDTLSYPTLGIHSTAWSLMAPTAVAPMLESLLAGTSKISIFCTGYSQGNGCHDVHYKNGAGEDGAIVLDPTSASSPILFFRFATPSF